MCVLPHLAVECAAVLALALAGSGLAGCASAGPDQAQPLDAPASVVVDSAPAVDAIATTNSCTSAQTCLTAMSLGSISGDTGGETVTASGYQSGWVKVRVTEDNGGIGGQKLKVTATLTSPGAMAAFDVFVYVDSDNDVVECTSPSGTATTSGNVETLSTKWGEGSLGNMDDDSRTVSIEVRPKSTSCSSADTWQLVVKGD